jgi:hypothetical protein
MRCSAQRPGRTTAQPRENAFVTARYGPARGVNEPARRNVGGAQRLAARRVAASNRPGRSAVQTRTTGIAGELHETPCPRPAIAALAGGYAAGAAAQSTPPALPPLNATQQADVQRQLDLYRTEIDGRVSRGEITADEAARLLKWREWQLAQQALGLGTAPEPVAEDAPPSVPSDYAPPSAYAAQPPTYYAPPYYVPYYPPRYYAPYYPRYYAPYYAPYYGLRVCAGGWGHHVGGSFCF